MNNCLKKISFAVFFAIFYALFFAPVFVLANGGDSHSSAHPSAVQNGYLRESDIKKGTAVLLKTLPEQIVPAVPVNLGFSVVELPDKKYIPFTALSVSHTKLMHAFGVRDDLHEFMHIHPTPTSEQGIFAEEVVFEKPGIYHFWSQIVRDGTEYTIRHAPITVVGQTDTRLLPKASFGKSVVVGTRETGAYQVLFNAPERIGKRREAELNFTVRTATGANVELENLLGASMHLIAIKKDLRQFLHGHPEEAHAHGAMLFVSEAKAHGGVADEHPEELKTVNFHMTFPESGDYKLFAQFRPLGAVLAPEETFTAEFWVRVEESAWSQNTAWWTLLIISLILIAILSFAVNKYITRPTD